ncbi:MAG: UDP-N-acetylglucosamine 1-carboxyvinyltransferase [Clostridia bacterium]|nr:UDP-N-acetylglucosamine 1-carboxyvinyltransferase [Clostridia bacterium]
MKESILVCGGKLLSGSVRVQGAKNSALPILAACILNGGTTVIKNCPMLSDTAAMLDILEYIGCKIAKNGNTVTVDSSRIRKTEVPAVLMQRLRSSIVILGALLARAGCARVCGPGGCELGARPIDLHLSGLQTLGAEIYERDGVIDANRGTCRGGEVVLAFPSVGATENLMLFGVCCREGITIVNAAREPEICDLAGFLSALGYSVSGAGSAVVRVARGRLQRKTVSYKIIPDRIAAATWMCAVAAAGGEAELLGADIASVQCIADLLARSGCRVENGSEGIYICLKGRLRSPGGVIRTGPYPCFPTDAQPLLSAVLTRASGTTVFEENMFENRYSHMNELSRMGADVRVEGKFAVINGVDKLTGRTVTSHDLRGGAALVVAGLGAEGETRILDVGYIDRGYEAIEKTLASLGADARRVAWNE